MKKMYEQDYDDIMYEKMKEKNRLIYLYQELKKDDEPNAMAFLEFAEDSIEDNWKTIQRIIDESCLEKNEVEKNDMC